MDTRADTAVDLEQHRPALWRVAYRLTGSNADAADVVQETFARALSAPEVAKDDGLRRWLIRVATNVAIDMLRRRRRMRYRGEWLPTPVELPEAVDDRSDPAVRYGTRESLSFAFLIALEALTPRQRAVLLLRDALGYSARETGAILAMSEGNARVTHLRARRVMRSYEASRPPPVGDQPARTRAALLELLRCLDRDDGAALERILAAEVRVTTDGGGEFNALKGSLRGRARVARFLLRVARRRTLIAVEERVLNGLPGLVLRMTGGPPPAAPRAALLIHLDGDGHVAEVAWVLATRKLAGLDRPV
jgi:RNA polymerase sigma-70 factor (ECF subfamily)